MATLLLLLKNRDRLQEPRTTATYGFLYHQFKYFLPPPASRTSTPACVRSMHLLPRPTFD